MHLDFHMHWKLCRDLIVMTVPVQDQRMQLHTLLGMQAGDMSLHTYAFLCIHGRYLIFICYCGCEVMRVAMFILRSFSYNICDSVFTSMIQETLC